MTPLSKEWKALIEAAGGVDALCESLGISQSTFHRTSRGMRAFPKDRREALQILCELYDVANPLDTQAQPRAKDLAPLAMLGDALAKGFPPAARTIEKLRAMYPQAQLLELAESDGAPENILRAVTKLLEEE